MIFSFGDAGRFCDLVFYCKFRAVFVVYAKKYKNVFKVNAMPAQVKNRHIPAAGRL